MARVTWWGGWCPARAHTWAEMAGAGALHKPCPDCARRLKGRCLRRCSVTLVVLLAGVFSGFSEQVCLQVLLSWHGHSSTDSVSLIRVKTAFPGGASGKNSPCGSGDTTVEGSVSWWGRPLRVGDGNPLQCSCLENSMDGGSW